MIKLTVTNAYTDRQDEFSGREEDVLNQIQEKWDWLEGETTIESALAKIQKVGHLFTQVEQIDKPFDPQRFDSRLKTALDAAKFLSGKNPDPYQVRQALVDSNEDISLAVLQSVGMDANEVNLAALKGVSGAMLAKSEFTAPTKFQKILPLVAAGEQFAQVIHDASDHGKIKKVSLGGVHSGGSYLAYSPKYGEKVLLKPGFGHQSPASGAHHSKASQSKREAAFYQIARDWGLGDSLPETHLLLIDGKEYAVIRWLPEQFQDFNKLIQKDPGVVRAFHIPLAQGLLHKWAILDYVLGNPDRHGGNVMLRGDEFKLIDHGSAFAGKEFNPAHDWASFVPFYLRAWAPHFSKMTVADKLRVMPRLGNKSAEELKTWLKNIDPYQLRHDLLSYGIDPQYITNRLNELKVASETMPVDLAINSAWVK